MVLNDMIPLSDKSKKKNIKDFVLKNLPKEEEKSENQ